MVRLITRAVAEPRRDEFPNNFVGDLVHTDRGWVVVPDVGYVQHWRDNVPNLPVRLGLIPPDWAALKSPRRSVMRPPHQMVTPTPSESDTRHTTINCSRSGGAVGGLRPPVGQSSFRQGWQLCVKNALSLGWIIAT